jgi:hypothetical protein
MPPPQLPASPCSRVEGRLLALCVCPVCALWACVWLSRAAVKINDPTAEGDGGADGDGKASFEFADFDEVGAGVGVWVWGGGQEWPSRPWVHFQVRR